MKIWVFQKELRMNYSEEPRKNIFLLFFFSRLIITIQVNIAVMPLKNYETIFAGPTAKSRTSIIEFLFIFNALKIFSIDCYSLNAKNLVTDT